MKFGSCYKKAGELNLSGLIAGKVEIAEGCEGELGVSGGLQATGVGGCSP